MQDVCDLFERYGWAYRKQDERTLLADFRGESRDFVVGARLDDSWLTLTVVSYLPPLPSEPERLGRIHRRLLELNAQMSIARFAINRDAEIILTADLPGHKKLGYDIFATAMDALTFFACDTYPLVYDLIAGEDYPGADSLERS